MDELWSVIEWAREHQVIVALFALCIGIPCLLNLVRLGKDPHEGAVLYFLIIVGGVCTFYGSVLLIREFMF